jgi:DNA-directed RNA polymerase specialized sigma24 family protein
LAVAFDRYRDTLTRLALFLHGRSDLAQSCVIDASLANTSCNQVFVDWLENWARYSTIAAAIRLMRDPIDEAARSYEGRRCTCPSHTVQASELVSASEVGPGGARLDALARFAVVLRGIERKPVSESALLLGIPAALVETAYCAALQVLRIHPVARRTQSA